ncbi:MAG: response regulator transcription factor [Erysipelotrichaceae bacterium]|nr:response regulator transcription factor [Erysipelotrichaceae bacterium]
MIVCVEDELNIQELIVYTLNSTGYKASGVSNGVQLDALLNHQIPELILLDLMLPDESGMDILKRLRENKRTKDIPVIILTAKSSEMDKILGLDSGADDYITKPFSMLELISRIKAVLRRTSKETSDVLVFRDLKMDLSKHIVMVENEKIALTLKEYELLKKLMQNPGVVCSRDMLLDEIWGYDYYGESRTVDVHIRTLRSKLGKAETYIETIRGVGYKLID